MVRRLNWNTSKRFIYKKPVTIADKLNNLLRQQGPMTEDEMHAAFPNIRINSIRSAIKSRVKTHDFLVVAKVIRQATGYPIRQIGLSEESKNLTLLS